ncbi:purine permease [Ketobacter sp. MCCC 1A13808]|uniref:uracil-xanthine permease family protein n=1 Tax=Ketobacter sp. MCCC 1A13808 TaxID=2602738 RepID=UPI000F1F457B|nr:nucleobase:cation symporter-2 family protein [Ketobacter sp. MCCC 1A13808]MVF12015.1 purine permease [Ketobacter sp. MCCC 1A13808]RLP52745.1 MAG: purine permease [Ketobacter sp.]
MNSSDSAPSDMIYPLDSKPPFMEATFAAIQHVLASFVGIITPTLIIGGVLGLGEHIPYLISMSLMVSGVGTFIQARRPAGIGAGMICVQGTSFAFLGTILAAGFIAKGQGGGPDEMLSLIFGVCFLGAFIEMFLSQLMHKLSKVITPLVTGIVITIIGISLIKVGMTDLAGGFNATDFGSWQNLSLGLFVLVLIIALNQSRNQWIRLTSIVSGLVAGFIISGFLGKLDFSHLSSLPLISVPVPFKYGFSFDWAAFVPIALIYVITTIESTGDITANCLISKQPIEGDSYLKRVKGGVLADGLNSAIAAIFNTFPNTTFSQNNGVIQLTGIASRHVGLFIAVVLMVLGLFPVIGGILQQIPKPVLGGATLVMFGTVAAAGVKILANEDLDRRKMLIMAVSFGVGLGVSMVPNVLDVTPKVIQNIFGSPVTTGGLMAIVLNLLMPEEHRATEPVLSKA